MRQKKSIIHLMLYTATAATSVLMALWLATTFVAKSRSQVEPSANNPADPNAKLAQGPDNSPDNGRAEDKPPESIGEDIESFLAPYNYDSENRRDPFREFKAEAISTAEDGVLIGPLRPLQRFTLDEIQLVGIIWDVEAPKAMFVDPNGKIHILSKDERVGRKNGYIAAIREGEVVIVETVRVRGQLAFSTRVMKITR